jgi:hypothetical protein
LAAVADRDGFKELCVQPNKALFQPVDVCLNVSPGGAAHGSEPIALSSEHLDDLTFGQRE